MRDRVRTKVDAESRPKLNLLLVEQTPGSHIARNVQCVRPADLTGHDEDEGAEAVPPQDRKRVSCKIRVAVVEGKENRATRKRYPIGDPRRNLRLAERNVAAATKPV